MICNRIEQIFENLHKEPEHKSAIPDICQTVTNAICSPDFSKKHPGKISNARWLATANPIRLLHASYSEPSNSGRIYRQNIRTYVTDSKIKSILHIWSTRFVESNKCLGISKKRTKNCGRSNHREKRLLYSRRGSNPVNNHRRYTALFENFTTYYFTRKTKESDCKPDSPFFDFDTADYIDHMDSQKCIL